MSAFRLVAPAGAPVPVRSVLPAFLERGSEVPGLNAFRERLGVRSLSLVSSGRAALTLLLQAMQEGSERREVIVPAYTCFSVPSAVTRAGLTIRLCDVDPETLDLDLNALVQLDLPRALCIVPSSLYGLPGELSEMELIARAFGTFLIDDAAQCLGATKDARPCGTFGDAGFYSLGRGKGITTMGGAILVTDREDLAPRIEAQIARLPRPSAYTAGAALASSLIYSGMLNPSRYWLVDRIPFLDLGGSHFDVNFPMTQLSAYQQRLAEHVLPLLDSYNKVRRDHADHLRSGLAGVDGISIPRPVAGAQPVYLRFPIVCRDAAHRASLLRRLREAGISASASYPTAVQEIPGIARHLAPNQADCPWARTIASRLLTLPTHPWVTGDDVERMVAIVRKPS
jgi:dTDP-4-amino-4,6-dideoxygalactose transaminase